MLKKLRKMSLHTHFSIRTVIIVLGLIITLISQASGRNDIGAGMWVGLILMISGIIWHILFIRCPHCGNPFHMRGGIPKHCPNCGKYIDKFH